MSLIAVFLCCSLLLFLNNDSPFEGLIIVQKIKFIEEKSQSIQ